MWLVGREVTFVDYTAFTPRSLTAPRIGSAVVKRAGETETHEVPLWLLARDEAESLTRANAIPLQLKSWDID